MTTLKDRIGDRLASMNEISSRLTQRTFSRIVTETYDELVVNYTSYGMEVNDLTIFDTLETVIAECINGYFDSEI
tara:strand:- start:273 stop:497 length:225 start_codon:yes stop_codon:yes gene_type:complete